MTPEELAEVHNAARYANVLPYLEADLVKMQEEITRSVIRDINNKDFTPDKAYLAWMEYAAHAKLLAKLKTRVKVATSTADKHSAKLNIG